MDWKQLHEKFERRKQWLIFEKEEVIRRVMVRYKAREIPKTDILDLENDDQLSYEHIFCCLTIDDPNVLRKIFSKQERADFEWERQDNLQRGRVYRYKDDVHRRYNELLIDEMEGRRLDVVFESKDGRFVTNFLTRSMCQEVDSYIFSHTGGAKYSGVLPRTLWQSDLTEAEIKESYRDYLLCLQQFNKF